MVVIKHKAAGYLSGFNEAEPIFCKKLQNAIQLSIEEAIDIADMIDDGHSISTVNVTPLSKRFIA